MLEGQGLFTDMEKQKYNIEDYMLWRGDIELDNKNINEIDALALTQIAYLDFSDAFVNKECVPLYEAIKNVDGSQYEKEIFATNKNRYNLAILMAETPRFKNLMLSNYVNNIDKDSDLQFSAISFDIDSKLKFVSFRGTDGTLVGWKEDLQLSYTTPVPAQEESSKYLNNIAKGLKKKIIIAGHSKGGNLAIYSAMFAYKNTKKKISLIYSFDGPGFEENIIKSENYKEISDRIRLYIPQNTVVGAILNIDCMQKVVQSDAMGIVQHDAFSWNLIGNKFIESKRTQTSIKFGNELDNWLLKYDKITRKKLIGFLFDTLEESGVETINDINLILKSSSAFLEGLNDLDKEQKSGLLSMLKLIISYNAGSVTEQIKEKNIFSKLFNK